MIALPKNVSEKMKLKISDLTQIIAQASCLSERLGKQLQVTDTEQRIFFMVLFNMVMCCRKLRRGFLQYHTDRKGIIKMNQAIRPKNATN
jgi:hypothetical protein